MSIHFLKYYLLGCGFCLFCWCCRSVCVFKDGDELLGCIKLVLVFLFALGLLLKICSLKLGGGDCATLLFGCVAGDRLGVCWLWLKTNGEMFELCGDADEVCGDGLRGRFEFGVFIEFAGIWWWRGELDGEACWWAVRICGDIDVDIPYFRLPGGIKGTIHKKAL